MTSGLSARSLFLHAVAALKISLSEEDETLAVAVPEPRDIVAVLMFERALHFFCLDSEESGALTAQDSRSVTKIKEAVRRPDWNEQSFLRAILLDERLDTFWQALEAINPASLIVAQKPIGSVVKSSQPGVIGSDAGSDMSTFDAYSVREWLRFLEQADETLQSLSQES